MSTDALLSRLERVRRTGPSRWLALCPAHDDQNPSLAVRELNDGRVLLHCFSGCNVHSVLSAISLEMAELFPGRDIQHGRPERRPFHAADILRALEFEAMVVAVAASTMAQGEVLSEVDRNRMMKAAERICAAVQGSGYAN